MFFCGVGSTHGRPNFSNQQFKEPIFHGMISNVTIYVKKVSSTTAYKNYLILTVMTTSTPEKTDGLKALNDAIVVVQEKIESLGGVFNIQMAVSILFSCWTKRSSWGINSIVFML